MKRFNLSKPGILILAATLIFGCALFAFAANVDFDHRGVVNLHTSADPPDNDPAWGDWRESCSASLSADVLDNDGNIAGTFSLSISRYYYGQILNPNNQVVKVVQYSASSSAYAGSEWEGRGNAWVRVPGNGQKGEGAQDIGGEGEPSGVSAYDSCLRGKGTVGGNNATASAGLWQGGVSANVKINISGF